MLLCLLVDVNNINKKEDGIVLYVKNDYISKEIFDTKVEHPDESICVNIKMNSSTCE